MISLPSGTRIWLVAGVTDMRKSFNGLGELVQHALDETRSPATCLSSVAAEVTP
jgi:transposase